VATSLPSALVGLAVAQRGGPDPVVSGPKCDGGGGQWECCLTVLGSSKGQWVDIKGDELSLDSLDD